MCVHFYNAEALHTVSACFDISIFCTEGFHLSLACSGIFKMSNNCCVQSGDYLVKLN